MSQSWFVKRLLEQLLYFEFKTFIVLLVCISSHLREKAQLFDLSLSVSLTHPHIYTRTLSFSPYSHSLSDGSQKNLFWCQAFGTIGILPNSSVPLWHVVMLYNSDVIRWETVTHIQRTTDGGFRWQGIFSSWSVFFKHSLFLNYGPTNQGEGDQ